MIFRPKIFISSTFTGNEELRNQIRDYFYSVGAEPLLYEYELTPSIQPMTYRMNLSDADFMIMIVKDYYGTETESGLSGIHEEYKIAHNNDIPLHVYLKKESSSLEVEDNPLIDDLKKDGISYYYFDNDEDLLKRLKETTFTIAKEIMLKEVETSKIPKESIIRLAGNTDYLRAIQVVAIIESMRYVVQIYELDWIYSNMFAECLERIGYEFSSLRHNFINWKIDDAIREMLCISDEYRSHYMMDFFPSTNSREYPIKILNTVNICSSSYKKSTNWTLDDYRNNMEEFFKAYEIFKKLIQNIKTEIDTI